MVSDLFGGWIGHHGRCLPTRQNCLFGRCVELSASCRVSERLMESRIFSPNHAYSALHNYRMTPRSYRQLRESKVFLFECKHCDEDASSQINYLFKLYTKVIYFNRHNETI